MDNKKIILTLGVLILFVFVIGGYSTVIHSNNDNIINFLDETDTSLSEGCCSVVCQLDGNNSLISFRRDADYSADIYIEKINWHGKEAVKQYKTEGGYFCQVIVTDDGWVIGYGGSDDGDDSKLIEDLTADMVIGNNISDTTLKKIQDIKNKYNHGHIIIKAPDGKYGAVINTTHFTGKLNDGDYISVPNKYSYFRSGNIPLDSEDKIKIMNQIEISDAYGLLRRDITTFYFHTVNNDTFNGNVTDVFISNDDGSYYDLGVGDYADDVYFDNTLFKSSDIPFAPDYSFLGSVVFDENSFDVIINIVLVILVIADVILIIRLINNIRYSKRRGRR